MAMAPNPKLKMRVVVYVRTSPLAAMAKTPAVHRPVIVSVRNLSTTVSETVQTTVLARDAVVLLQLDRVARIAVEDALVRLGDVGNELEAAIVHLQERVAIASRVRRRIGR